MTEPDPADEAPRERGYLPPPVEDDAAGAFRMKVLLAGIGVLFVIIFVVVIVLVATRERTVPRDTNPPRAPAAHR